MKGKLYGVGVGPGDPELLTLKAVRVMKECSYIALPASTKESCTAYQIAKQALPEMDSKNFVYLTMPMTKDNDLLTQSHNLGGKAIETILNQGQSVCFLTLGDPTVYSTYLYIHKIVSEHGYPTEIISGIPSFCAASAALNMGLVEGSQPLVIIPASYPTDQFLSIPGTKVLMKTGKQMDTVKTALKDTSHSVSMVENCGMPNQKLYSDLDSIPNESGYFSLIIAKHF